MSAARWERLQATLAEHGVESTVDTVTFPGGISRKITIRTATGVVCVTDAWWRKNEDVWIGWQAWLEGRDSIVRRSLPATKKRGEVARWVAEALEQVVA